MRNSVASNRRLAARVFACQVVAAALVAACAGWFGSRHALGALIGGLAVAAGTGLFALRFFARDAASAGSAAVGFFVGTAMKWIVVLFILYLAIARLELPMLAVLAGLVAAYAMNVVGLLFERTN